MDDDTLDFLAQQNELSDKPKQEKCGWYPACENLADWLVLGAKSGAVVARYCREHYIRMREYYNKDDVLNTYEGRCKFVRYDR